MMAVELSLGDADGGIEVVVGQGGVQNFVAVVLQVGRFDAAWSRLPAVEEEDSHGDQSNDNNRSLSLRLPIRLAVAVETATLPVLVLVRVRRRQFQCSLLELYRLVELSGLGVGGGERVEIVAILPLSQFAGQCSMIDGLLSVTKTLLGHVARIHASPL